MNYKSDKMYEVQTQDSLSGEWTTKNLFVPEPIERVYEKRRVCLIPYEVEITDFSKIKEKERLTKINAVTFATSLRKADPSTTVIVNKLQWYEGEDSAAETEAMIWKNGNWIDHPKEYVRQRS